MTKQCTFCGGAGRQYDADTDTRGYRCDHCGGTGESDNAEHESAICPNCEGNGCGACRWSGEAWVPVDIETSEVAE